LSLPKGSEPVLKGLQPTPEGFDPAWHAWVPLLLGTVSVALLWITGRPWGLAQGFSLGRLFETGNEPGLVVQVALVNAGIVLGSAVTARSRGEFRFHLPPTVSLALQALVGGLIMGIGARLAYGCNVGGMLGGISSFSLHGWVYLVALSAGAYLGVQLLRRLYS